MVKPTAHARKVQHTLNLKKDKVVRAVFGERHQTKLGGAPLLFQPGSGFQYSNTGFVIVAELIAQTSGESYEKFMTDRIFTILDMSNSGFEIASDIKGYIAASGGGIKEAPVFDKLGPDGAGGSPRQCRESCAWPVIR